MGLQVPFETGDYNGVSEELQNLHGPNANRNSANCAPYYKLEGYRQYPAIWSVKGMTLEERAGFVAELSAQYGCEAFFRHFSGWDASCRTQPEMWMAKLREEERLGKAWRKRPATHEWRANGMPASPSERSAHIGGCFQKIGVLQNGWFIMENPIKMDDLGGKPTIFGNTQVSRRELLL